MPEPKPEPVPPYSGTAPVTVDPDIHAHMLGTYSSLRQLLIVVTVVFLASLSVYRLVGHDPVVRNSISAYYHHHNDDVRVKELGKK